MGPDGCVAHRRERKSVVITGTSRGFGREWAHAALEGFSQALAQEVTSFGLHVTLIEPGGFDTDWSGPSAKHADPLPDYDEVRAAVEAERSQRWASPGNAAASADALLKVVDADEPPLRVSFGASPLAVAKADYESRLLTWEQWQPVAELAQG
jgi:NAD(P)-dependent dehydrogenase (short-subunit alcohol dehydrogenase family)